MARKRASGGGAAYGFIKDMFLGEGAIPFAEEGVAKILKALGLHGAVPGPIGMFIKFMASKASLPNPVADAALKQLGQTLAASGPVAEVSVASKQQFEANLQIAIEFGGIVPPQQRDVITEGQRPQILKQRLMPDDPLFEYLREGRNDREVWIRTLVQKVEFLLNHATADGPTIPVRSAGKELQKALHSIGPFWLLEIAKEEYLCPQQLNLGDPSLETYEGVKAAFIKRPIIENVEFMTGHAVFNTVDHNMWAYGQFVRKMELATSLAAGLVENPWMPGDAAPPQPQFQDARPVQQKALGTLIGNPAAKQIAEIETGWKRRLTYLAVVLLGSGFLWLVIWAFTRKIAH